MEERETIADSTTRIVESYIKANPVGPDVLASLIREVGRSLSQLGQISDGVGDTAPTPAVSPRKSIGNDALVCLECGAQQRMLKRHLMKKHGLTPEAYRERYGLAGDYPMVAPNYSAKRSQLAKEIGLGNINNQAR